MPGQCTCKKADYSTITSAGGNMYKSKHSAVALALAAALIGGTEFSYAASAVAIAQGSTLVFQTQGITGISSAKLRVNGPNGFTQEKTARGSLPSFDTVIDGKPLPDGSYQYELTIRQPMPAALQAEFGAALARNEETATSIAPALGNQVAAYGFTVSGSFGMLNGALLTASTSGQKRRDSAPGAAAMADQVIADDLIVQGSACVGLDCVNNESFGFDTIRLKENNTRIVFDDTSTSAGFPNHDWQLTANDSASGGANKFSIEDITAHTVPFTVTGSAPTNSVFVDSSGRVGFRTSTPVLDLHVATSNTPALRMEQTNAGGFTAQTWDIGSNEANFFVRDVTGGSRLPFRIRPGAPTSSIDISSAGNVGLGTASPQYKMDISGGGTSKSSLHLSFAGTDVGGWLTSLTDNYFFMSSGTAYDAAAGGWMQKSSDGNSGLTGIGPAGYSVFLDTGRTVGVAYSPTRRLHVNYSGELGINTDAVAGTAIKTSTGAILTAGGTWQNSSSRAHKENIKELTGPQAILALAQLNPVTYNYKVDAQEKHVGFIAEDVPDLVASKDRTGLSALDIVAVLTKVLQEQKKIIDSQQKSMADFQASTEERLARLLAKIQRLESQNMTAQRQ